MQLDILHYIATGILAFLIVILYFRGRKSPASEPNKKSRAMFYNPAQVLHAVYDSVNGLLKTKDQVMSLWDDGAGNANVNLQVDNVGLAVESGGNLADSAASLGIVDDWDATQDSPISADGPQIMAEAKDFDGAALPNTVAEGDAVRPAVSLSGVGFAMLVSKDGSQSPQDSALNLVKTQEQSPPRAQFTDVAPVITAAQNLTASWADLGSEILKRAFYDGTYYFTFDVNTSVGAQLRFLNKHTSAGAEEYPCRVGVASATGQITLVDEIWLLGDADALIPIEIGSHHATPYYQLQVKHISAAGTVGQIDAAYVTKG